METIIIEPEIRPAYPIREDQEKRLSERLQEADKRLREYLNNAFQKSGMDIRDLVNQSQISQSGIYRLLKSPILTQTTNLILLCDALGLSIKIESKKQLRIIARRRAGYAKSK